MNACVRGNTPWRKERMCVVGVVVGRKSLASASEGLGDGNGEVGEPSVLVFRGSELWL